MDNLRNRVLMDVPKNAIALDPNNMVGVIAKALYIPTYCANTYGYDSSNNTVTVCISLVDSTGSVIEPYVCGYQSNNRSTNIKIIDRNYGSFANNITWTLLAYRDSYALEYFYDLNSSWVLSNIRTYSLGDMVFSQPAGKYANSFYYLFPKERYSKISFNDILMTDENNNPIDTINIKISAYTGTSPNILDEYPIYYEPA